MGTNRVWGIPRRLALVGGVLYLGVSVATWYALGARQAAEEEALRGEEPAAIDTGPAYPPPPDASQAPIPHPISGTRVSAAAVGGAVTSQVRTSAVCIPLDPTGLGVWTCTHATGVGGILPARVFVDDDGAYRGIRLDAQGKHIEFGGCCLTVGP
jgi:hypothetical protein